MKRLVNLKPDPLARTLLSLAPFALLLVLYLIASDARLALNPDDKLLPSLSQFGQALHGLALEENKRTGEIILWADTLASLKRLGIALGISAAVSLVVGVLLGALPYLRALLSPFVAVLSMIPPLAILPILFIVFGLDELSKVVLIVIGITPVMIRDLAMRVEELPREQLIKAQTLGASSWLLILRVILPQLMPRLIDALRLVLGSAWLFLIAAEAIAATDGLGYRIFLVRRYLAMDTIIPYVVWITLLAFAMDLLLRSTSRTLFPWYQRSN